MMERILEPRRLMASNATLAAARPLIPGGPIRSCCVPCTHVRLEALEFELFCRTVVDGLVDRHRHREDEGGI